MVIVILGILSAVAFPRFADLSRDAKLSVIDALYGAMEVAISEARLKAHIAGVADNARSSEDDGPAAYWTESEPLELKYGYPEAYAEDSGSLDIVDLLDLSEDLEICYSVSCISTNSSRVKIGLDTTEGTGCYVRYSEPGGSGSTSATEYALIKVTDGC